MAWPHGLEQLSLVTTFLEREPPPARDNVLGVGVLFRGNDTFGIRASFLFTVHTPVTASPQAKPP